MHQHSHSKFQPARWAAPLLLVLPALALGQGVRTPPIAPAPPPVAAPVGRGGALVVSINGTQRVQMRTKKRIIRVDNPKDNVARVQPIPNDPTSVLITGLDAGITQVTLVDEAGTFETIDIV